MSLRKRRSPRHLVSSSSVGLLLASMVVSIDANFSCDHIADQCPTKNDGVCDSSGGNPLCVDGDCRDCDQCVQFNADCQACVDAIGCNWCPTDGTCHNSLYTSFGSCTNADNYITDGGTCADSSNFFFTLVN